MQGRAQARFVVAMMAMLLAAAPAALCLRYLAQNTQSHSCCPQKSAPSSNVVPVCCVQSPAVTSNVVSAPAFVALLADAFVTIPSTISVFSETLDTIEASPSPPHCSSILRIWFRFLQGPAQVLESAHEKTHARMLFAACWDLEDVWDPQSLHSYSCLQLHGRKPRPTNHRPP